MFDGDKVTKWAVDTYVYEKKLDPFAGVGGGQTLDAYVNVIR